MKSFQWKVVSLMLLVSALPSIAGAIIVENLVRDTISLGLDQRVGQGLERAVTVYPEYIRLRKHTMKLQAQQLARDPKLLTLLRAEKRDSAALQTLLDARSKELEDTHQRTAFVGIRPLLTSPNDPSTPPTAPLDDDSSLSWIAHVDHRTSLPKNVWRGKEFRSTIIGFEGERYLLVTKLAIPWDIFHNFDETQKVSSIFQNLNNTQATLTQAYTRTFYAITAAVLLLTFAVAFLLARATTQRLERLALATAKVAGGDLNTHVEVEGSDEIALLTHDFNTMVVELRQARTRLAYLERVSAWQEIARRLAHEIKNPLTPILLAVQQLDRKFDDYHTKPDRYRRLVTDAQEIVTEEVGELKKLVKEFSDFARLPEVEPTPTRTATFVRDLLKNNPQFNPYLHTPPLSTQPDPFNPITPIDSTMMRRALINLLRNATEAIDDVHPDDPTDTLRVHLQLHPSDPNLCQLLIEDQGSGIESRHQRSIFDPYFTTKSDGTGLGLSIVKKIILDHNGDISLTSPLSPETQGTRMTITLPLLRETQDAA